MRTEAGAARRRRRRIVVLGYIVRGPLAGLVWHHLQYVMGLARMGHDVCFLEDSGDTPWCCYDPSRDATDTDPTFGLAFAARAFDAGGIPNLWAYYDAHTATWHGPQAASARERCEGAELLLNLSGANILRPWTQQITFRAYVDTDPAFTQIRHLTDPDRRQLAAQHTSFFTFGENIGRGATFPDDGFPWQPTRQPIVLDAWRTTAAPAGARFTTVMQWDAYQVREYEGHRYGMKSESFKPYLTLPQTLGPLFEISVGGRAAAEVLCPHGWVVRNPIAAMEGPRDYQRFIQESKAEFTVAKQGYVESNSGWFSERSAAYLASGRPVVTEDTGFRRWLPPGDGLLSYKSVDEAARAVRDVLDRYDDHARAARAIAERYFEASQVLTQLLDRALPG